MFKILKRKKELTKKRNRVNLIVSFALLIFGLLLFSLTWLELLSPVKVLYVIFSYYALVKLIEYFLAKNGTDNESLYTAIVSAMGAISGFRFIDYEPRMVLSLTLVCWVGAMCVVKLIKLDYYHDRDNGMLYVNLVSFSLFLLLGLLTSANLYYSEQVRYLMLAFFFTVNGILSLAENGIRILVANKNKLNIEEIN